MPNKSMPFGDFRRPELQAAHEIDSFCKGVPSKYLRLIPGNSNSEKYMAFMLLTERSVGSTFESLRMMLEKYPFHFKFNKLSQEERLIYRHVTSKFTSVELVKFFRTSGSTFTMGLQSLSRIIKEENNIRKISQLMELEIENIRKVQVEFAMDIASKLRIKEPNLQEIRYLYGPSNKFELSELFFHKPSFFVNEEVCTNCERELTNWISVVLGKGPVCGKHKYEIKIIGQSIREITDHIINLVENRYLSIFDRVLSEQSALLEFRRSRINYFWPEGNLYWDLTSFSREAILRDMTSEGRKNGEWLEYIESRVISEYGRILYLDQLERDKFEDIDEESVEDDD